MTPGDDDDDREEDAIRTDASRRHFRSLLAANHRFGRLTFWLSSAPAPLFR